MQDVPLEFFEALGTTDKLCLIFCLDGANSIEDGAPHDFDFFKSGFFDFAAFTSFLSSFLSPSAAPPFKTSLPFLLSFIPFSSFCIKVSRKKIQLILQVIIS